MILTNFVGSTEHWVGGGFSKHMILLLLSYLLIFFQAFQYYICSSQYCTFGVIAVIIYVWVDYKFVDVSNEI